MIITREFIESGGTPGARHNGVQQYSWNAKQYSILGISPSKGWINSLVGKELPDGKAAEFIALKGCVSERTKKIKAKRERARNGIKPKETKAAFAKLPVNEGLGGMFGLKHWNIPQH